MPTLHAIVWKCSSNRLKMERVLFFLFSSLYQNQYTKDFFFSLSFFLSLSFSQYSISSSLKKKKASWYFSIPSSLTFFFLLSDLPVKLPRYFIIQRGTLKTIISEMLLFTFPFKLFSLSMLQLCRQMFLLYQKTKRNKRREWEAPRTTQPLQKYSRHYVHSIVDPF